ncbi:MAG: hypothetical protein Greene041619_866 [Candidatus Peregrinibacteria bacterium Greene0416_19]|nr:MAG: hypothetical protein Greene041619_866 [Candidatus Peregrinibacteria bacterium Greene0416_19]
MVPGNNAESLGAHIIPSKEDELWEEDNMSRFAMLGMVLGAIILAFLVTNGLVHDWPTIGSYAEMERVHNIREIAQDYDIKDGVTTVRCAHYDLVFRRPVQFEFNMQVRVVKDGHLIDAKGRRWDADGHTKKIDADETAHGVVTVQPSGRISFSYEGFRYVLRQS